MPSSIAARLFTAGRIGKNAGLPVRGESRRQTGLVLINGGSLGRPKLLQGTQDHRRCHRFSARHFGRGSVRPSSLDAKNRSSPDHGRWLLHAIGHVDPGAGIKADIVSKSGSESAGVWKPSGERNCAAISRARTRTKRARVDFAMFRRIEGDVQLG